jgi:hypothetical protein
LAAVSDLNISRAMSAPLPSSLDEYRALFAGHGDTDEEYLARHYRRFLQTFALFSKTWSPDQGARVLWKTRVRGALRFLSGNGAGVSVDDVLQRPTYAHHWKEYSVRELKRYFLVLSPDLRLNRALCFSGGVAHLGPFGRSIYSEIDLPAKQHGIVDDTAWG